MTLLGHSLLSVLLALPPLPGTAPAADRAIDRAARVMGLQDLHSILYSGSAVVYRLGQSLRPGGPWPEASDNPRGCRALIDYDSHSRELVTVRQRDAADLLVVQSVSRHTAWDGVGDRREPTPFQPEPEPDGCRRDHLPRAGAAPSDETFPADRRL